MSEANGRTAQGTWEEVLDTAAALRDAVARGDAPTTGFDVVYTSIGAISWLNDLDRWAAQIAAILRPGGLFYIRDGHQAMYALDEHAPDLRTVYRYFGDGSAQVWDDSGPTWATAPSPTPAPTSGPTHCRRWSTP